VRAELRLPADALLVGVIGRYHPVKDHAGFLESAALLRKKAPETHFLLIGRGVGDNPVLTERSSALALSGAVHFLGERTDVPRLAASLDIAVSSSYSESLPSVIGEAMSCGVPCVVTDVGDSAWLVGDTGMVVPPQNPAALAEACARLVRLGLEGRKELGAQARRRIVRQFSLSAFAGRYQRLYQQAIERRQEGKKRARYAA
jgi:glycosyltransferase involved in cell wall biosynthesis